MKKKSSSRLEGGRDSVRAGDGFGTEKVRPRVAEGCWGGRQETQPGGAPWGADEQGEDAGGAAPLHVQRGRSLPQERQE